MIALSPLTLYHAPKSFPCLDTEIWRGPNKDGFVYGTVLYQIQMEKGRQLKHDKLDEITLMQGKHLDLHQRFGWFSFRQKTLRDMKEEEEDLPFAQYFEKRGLGDMFKRIVAKLGRRNKKKKEKSQTTVSGDEGALVPAETTEDVEQQARGAASTEDVFEDVVDVPGRGGGGGGGSDDEIAPTPTGSSSVSPASGSPSPGGTRRRGRRPRYDSQGNPRPPPSAVGRKYFGC